MTILCYEIHLRKEEEDAKSEDANMKLKYQSGIK